MIHNAGVGYREPRIETVDGLSHLFAINVLAPYLLTSLMALPRRLVYLSSGMHRGGETQAWLAVSGDPAAQATGRLYRHRHEIDAQPAASDPAVQDALLDACRALTGESI